MRYDDMVDRSKAVKAPDIGEGRIGGMNSIASEGMVTMLKKVDGRTKLSIRVLQGVYVLMTLMAFVYTFILGDVLVRAGFGFLTVAFAMVIFLQQLRYRAYDETYEDAPMLEYLQRAKKRMRVFTVRTWFVLPIWILIDVGVCFFVAAAAERHDFSAPLAIGGVQMLLLLIVALDFLTDYLVWRKEHRPAVMEIDKILKEIETSG